MTTTLAVAAHATAGGGLPTGASATLLALLAVTIGTLVVVLRESANLRMLMGVLAVGQLLSHVALGSGGHVHETASAPWELMVAAHAVAVVCGALLIAIGGHLCAAVSRVLRSTAHRPAAPVAALLPVAVRSADQPLLSTLLVDASISHRGPPVCCSSS